jgi:uncharacterized membrane protein
MSQTQPHKTRKGTLSPGKITLQEYEGLLPDPENLAKFEKLHPGFADRMLTMAEQEMLHRRQLDNKIARVTLRSSLLGIIAAFLSVLAVCSLSAYALFLGHANAGASIVIGSAAAIVSAFLLSRRKRSRTGGQEV